MHVNQFLAFSDDPITEPEISGVIVDDSGNTWAGITLFIDVNGNGRYDDGEPTATTDANGNFTFKGVPNKGYAVLLMPGTISDVYSVKISIVNNVVIITLFANKMAYPTRLSWNPADGGYMAADFLLNSVFFYDSSDKLTHRLNGLDQPLSVATDATGGRIYVGNKGRRNVEVYTTSGRLRKTIGNGQLKMPNDIVLDRQQRVYVVDSQSKNVRVYNQDRSTAFIISQTDPSTKPFVFPKSLAIHYRMDGGTETGEIYVADKPSSFIHVFDLQGNYQRTLGGKPSSGMLGGWKDSEALFVNIQSIAFDQNGNLHVLDSSKDRVKIIHPVTGTGVGSYYPFQTGQGSQLPLDIDINETGQVIMTSFKTKSVQHIHTVQ